MGSGIIHRERAGWSLKKRIAILGSTGSIGTQALEVIEQHADRFQVAALAARSDVDGLARQVVRHNPSLIALTDPQAWALFRSRFPQWSQRLLDPHEALETLAAWDGCDLVLNALVGAAGVLPTLAALEAGKDVALANKETLVAGGEIVMHTAKKTGARVLPVDSEHSALFQCLDGKPIHEVERLILTASGGPFRDWPLERMERATRAQALRHPNWTMGGKITIDSATMMNKGLEVIEAYWLFGVPLESIHVWVHPQSIVHSLVAFRDGSVLAQLGLPDMRVPIQYALTYPERYPSPWPRLDLTACGPLTFEKPDPSRFPALELAYAALRAGGTMPAVLNAANEVAVELFLQERLPFLGIPRLVEAVMAQHHSVPDPSLEAVLEADRWARVRARELAGREVRMA